MVQCVEIERRHLMGSAVKALIFKLPKFTRGLTIALMRFFSPLYHMVMFAALSAVVMPSQAAVADESLEYQVKAAFLYKFGAFVDWPPSAFASPTSPFTLCLLDSSEHFNSILRKLVNGENVHGRPVVVREIEVPEIEDGCHVLYIGASDPQYTAEALEAAHGKNVLTVSDNASQGIIGFLIADNRVRFNIDAEAAAENGLVISSKLLNLAVNVKQPDAGGGQ